MSFESASQALKVNGGYTITGVNRVYGTAVKAGAAASSIIIKDSDGVILGASNAAATQSNIVYTNKPISTSGKTLTIEAVGNGGVGAIYVDGYTSLTVPSRNLVSRSTVLIKSDKNLVCRVTKG